LTVIKITGDKNLKLAVSRVDCLKYFSANKIIWNSLPNDVVLLDNISLVYLRKD